MVIDTITFNGEKELFEIRYNILKDYVDLFVVVEFSQTFSGKPKKWLFPELLDEMRVKGVYPKYSWYGVNDWSKYKTLAKSSPNTEYGKGASHWIREFAQKESLKDVLSSMRIKNGDKVEGIKDDDIVFIGDCDEIWNPSIDYVAKNPYKILLRVYSYWLNNRSDEHFWGTLVGKWGQIKDKCLNELRSQQSEEGWYGGWHFTSIGGYEKVKKKLTDSYTQESYASQYILDNLDTNIANNHDFLGRSFTYIKDETDWPQYLKDNKDKYKHLLRP